VSDEFLTAAEEKTCEICGTIGMLYTRRERLIADDQATLAMKLDIHIKQRLKDLKGWVLKNE